MALAVQHMYKTRADDDERTVDIFAPILELFDAIFTFIPLRDIARKQTLCHIHAGTLEKGSTAV